jgi:FkbM family methyltransferase
MDTALTIALRNASKARTLGGLALASNLPAPLVYADVGALWGIDNPVIQELRARKRLRVVGFEPDAAECERLRAANPDDVYLPFGVGDVDGQRPFYVTAFGACSSFLEPDPAALRGAPHEGLFRVASISAIPQRRMDSLIAQGQIPAPEMAKIDVQGFELQVLQGFGSRLDGVVGVRLETQLRPLYKGQALFMDIYAYMASRGFILRDLRLAPPFVYEVVELEAYFSRDPRMIGERYRALKLWEVIHDIPPGQTFSINPDHRIDWVEMPL